MYKGHEFSKVLQYRTDLWQKVTHLEVSHNQVHQHDYPPHASPHLQKKSTGSQLKAERRWCESLLTTFPMSLFVCVASFLFWLAFFWLHPYSWGSKPFQVKPQTLLDSQVDFSHQQEEAALILGYSHEKLNFLNFLTVVCLRWFLSVYLSTSSSNINVTCTVDSAVWSSLVRTSEVRTAAPALIVSSQTHPNSDYFTYIKELHRMHFLHFLCVSCWINNPFETRQHSSIHPKTSHTAIEVICATFIYVGITRCSSL